MMPAFKLTKDLYLEKKVDQSLLDSVKGTNFNSQFGFRDRRGCILQLLEVFDDWTLALDKGFSVDTIYLDFQKAFDSVPYNRLLVKLEASSTSTSLRCAVRFDFYTTDETHAGSCLQAELSCLCRLLESENARDQIDHLKKVLGSIEKKVDNTHDTHQGLLLALQFLVHLFFVSTAKNPIRRVLISYFQGTSATTQEDVIKPAIERAVVNILNQPIRREEDSNRPIRFEESNDLRHDVDTLSALLENFPLGEECIKCHCLEVLSYLGRLQRNFYLTYSNQLSPVQQNEIMHNCLETVKLANRICQRSSAVIETKVTENANEVRIISKCLFGMDVCILKSEEFLLDCRTTSAMNIALWLKTLFIQKESLLIEYLLQTVFKEFQSGDLDKACDWLEDLDLSQLEKSLLSDSAYLCLCYGLLAMFTVETMLTVYSGQRCLLLDILLPELLIMNKRCKDVGSKLLAAKSICLLTQRLSQYVKNNKDTCELALLTRLHGESTEMTQILQYIWTSWEDSVDAIRFTVKDTFQHVVAVHLQSLKAETNAADDKFLEKLTKSIITEVSWSCKGKYGTLAVLVGHLGSTRMLELHSGIAMDVLLQLKEQTLACYASDLYEKLFTGHMTELSCADSDWLSSWLPCWIDPVLKVLCGNNKTQKKHVIEYVLPKLLKTDPAALQHIVSKLSSGSQTEVAGTSVRGQQLGAMIICLRRARALGQLQGLSNRAERRLQKEGKSKKGRSKNKPSERRSNHSQSEMTGNTVQSDAKDVSQSAASSENIDQSTLWYGVVEVEVLIQALSSRDEQVCLDAFALLCENQKTTEVVSDLELGLIKGFIPYNLNNQMPSFRQHFLSHLKKLLSRMKESCAVLKRIHVSSKDSKAFCSLVRYKEFLVWLKQYLFSSLFPGSVFARRTTCLGGLSLLMEIFGDTRTPGVHLDEEFTFYELIDRCDIQKLLLCLTDTFEDNKREAATILIACSDHSSTSVGVLDENETKNLFHIALTLSSSTRPQDSTTAAYLFKVLIYLPVIFKVMKEHETSHHRKLAETGKEAGDQNEACDQNEAFGIKGCAIPETQLPPRENLNQNHKNYPGEEGRLKINALEDNCFSRHLLLLTVLLQGLKGQAEVAKSNLIVAAANCPMYPTMQCMRYCLADIDFREIPSEQQSDWKSFLIELISLCLKISDIVSPVVHNSSPEGNIPVDTMKGLNMTSYSTDLFEDIHSRSHKSKQSEDRISRSHETDQSEDRISSGQATDQSEDMLSRSQESDQLEDSILGRRNQTDQSEDRISRSHETVMLMPEYLVVCCWRSVKEISLILGQLTKDVPVSYKERESVGLLAHKQILDIGSYFTTQLLESKHRGAFELAYAGFVKVTEMLWRSTIADLHKLPRQWLKEVMHDVKSGDPESRLCATRRSAGVPFFVQALVTTEPVTTGQLCFKETMEELLALAFNDALDTVETSTSKVHALNILRALFKDTRLGDSVAPYIADGLKVAVLGFKSPLWAVRNSATLLMSAMMVRIFGVKRSKDETCLSRKNCQTGRTFFHRYPTLYQFLLDQLAESTVAMETGDSFHLHPALYPILMVLGHLFPSAMEGTDTTLNLMAFIPFVMKCSHSPVMKTRIMAARALQPLVDKDHVTRVFDDLLDMLPCDSTEDWKQNHIHGLLLQIGQLLKIVPTLSPYSQQELSSNIVPKWIEKSSLLMSRVNSCLTTRKESLKVSSDIHACFGSLGYESEITGHMTKILLSEIKHEGAFCRNIPGLTEFNITVCRLSIKFLRRLHLDSNLSSNAVIGYPSESGTPNPTEQNNDLKSETNENKAHAYELQGERIILRFLKSSVYEVRKSVLEIIKYCLLQKQVAALQKEEAEDLSTETDDSNCLLSRDEGEYLYEVLKSSSSIYEELVAMAVEKETYHECLTKVFSVLQYHPLIKGPGQVWKYSAEELLERLIEKARCQTRDEVLTAVIGYSGHLVGEVLQEINTLQRNSSPKDNLVHKKLGLVEKWGFMIQSNCGSEQNSDKQLLCVKAIAQNAEYLLCDRNNVLENLTFTFWKIVIDLIQEDDLEVKDAVAEILSVVDTSLKAPVHPYLALDLLLGQFICCQGNTKSTECISFLIGLIAEDADNTEALEERLFDRGEMNTYREPVEFIQLVDSHLLRLTRGEFPGRQPNTAHTTREATQHQCVLEDIALKGKKLFFVKESEFLTGRMWKNLQMIEKSISSLGSLQDKAGYLNASSFNRNILNIYRTIVILKYGLILPLDEHCKTRLVSLWENVQVAFSKNPLVQDLMKHLVTGIESLVTITEA